MVSGDERFGDAEGVVRSHHLSTRSSLFSTAHCTSNKRSNQTDSEQCCAVLSTNERDNA